MHTPYPSIKKEPVTKGSMAIQIPAHCLFYYKQKGGKLLITGIWCKKYNSYVNKVLSEQCTEAVGDGTKACFSGRCKYSTRAVAANITDKSDKKLLKIIKKQRRKQKKENARE